MADLLSLMRRRALKVQFSPPARVAVKEGLIRFRMINASSRMKPCFFLIGAMKSGTTSLFSNLVGHPQIAEPLSKEIRYFDFFHARGEEWYRAHFPQNHIHNEVITGEASPSYLFDPHAPARLHQFDPHARLIVLLRNPVDRAYSHYQHAVRYWNESRSFERAVREEEDWIATEQRLRMNDSSFVGVRRIQHSYLARGRYFEQIERWEQVFNRDQALFIRSEDYFEYPADIFAETLNFLGLTGWRPTEFQQLNMAQYTSLDDSTRNWLYDYFEPHNRLLYNHLARDMKWEAMNRSR